MGCRFLTEQKTLWAGIQFRIVTFFTVFNSDFIGRRESPDCKLSDTVLLTVRSKLCAKILHCMHDFQNLHPYNNVSQTLKKLVWVWILD